MKWLYFNFTREEFFTLRNSIPGAEAIRINISATMHALLNKGM
jgi:hypothetical protein